LQTKYLSVSGVNLDENIPNLDRILDEIGDFGRMKNDILDSMFDVRSVPRHYICIFISLTGSTRKEYNKSKKRIKIISY